MTVRYVSVDPMDVTRPYQYGDMSTKGIWRDLIPSIEKYGIVNPVILWATKGELRIQYGISRVQAALHLALPSIPAVVVDYDGRYQERHELKTIDEVAALWASPGTIRPYLNMTDTKLWMNHHPRVTINDNGDTF